MSAAIRVSMDKCLLSVQFSNSQKIKKCVFSQSIARIICALERRRPLVPLKLELLFYYQVPCFAQSSDKIPWPK